MLVVECLEKVTWCVFDAHKYAEQMHSPATYVERLDSNLECLSLLWKVFWVYEFYRPYCLLGWNLYPLTPGEGTCVNRLRMSSKPGEQDALSVRCFFKSKLTTSKGPEIKNNLQVEFNFLLIHFWIVNRQHPAECPLACSKFYSIQHSEAWSLQKVLNRSYR